MSNPTCRLLRGPCTLCCRVLSVSSCLQDLNRGKSGDVVQLGYQVGGALSTVRLPFRSMILDRYPEQDSPLFPFPGDQLPMFVYPKVRGEPSVLQRLLGFVCLAKAFSDNKDGTNETLLLLLVRC